MKAAFETQRPGRTEVGEKIGAGNGSPSPSPRGKACRSRGRGVDGVFSGARQRANPSSPGANPQGTLKSQGLEILVPALPG